jgi:histidinol-phosphate/aromatic aminotransferase/cobyric acid decarboxylase-like protein
MAELEIPPGTTLAVIVNPNNPNGGVFDLSPLPKMLRRHPDVHFLVDEAFIGLAGQSVAHRVPEFPNLLVTRTLSKAHSLAGFRVGYAILPDALADDLNGHNDAYPLARPSQAAALATLQHEDQIRARVAQLRAWAAATCASPRPCPTTPGHGVQDCLWRCSCLKREDLRLIWGRKPDRLLASPFSDAIRMCGSFCRYVPHFSKQDTR